jgi:hypothetical protein
MSARHGLFIAAAAAGLAVLPLAASGAAAQTGGSALVTVGSPTTHFPQNKQNEPAVAIDPLDPLIAVAGANDEIDLAPCAGSSCPFTPGVGLSGVYFSTNGGTSWTQPTYTGWSARSGTPGVGSIGTLPGYFGAGLVSDGDPALAFGPVPVNGHFSWKNGVRLYYGNLVQNFPGTHTFAGFEGVAVSRTDNIAAAMSGDASAWQAPVIVTRQNSALFSDKDAVWADNAASSPFFGRVYACNIAFRSQEISPKALPEPVMVDVSADGGSTWAQHQVSSATNNIATGGRQDCALRTASNGVVYLMYHNFNISLHSDTVVQQLSFDGGATFTRPQIVAVIGQTGQFDPVQGRFTIDGVAGARTSSFPSFDIANGAPSGAGATNEILLTWSDARAGLNKDMAWLEESTNGGRSYSSPAAISEPGDRANQPAIAISPDGTAAWLTYNAYLQPWQATTASARLEQGVVRMATIGAKGAPGAFTTVLRGATGDARASSANSLTSEFLGDYNDIKASATGAVAVWNDVRRATDCPVIDAFRQSLLTSSPLAKPAPPTQCPDTFGNSDIFSGSF